MLDALAALPEDPIWGLTSAFRADPRAHKIDMVIGVYRDDKGATPNMKAVRMAERAFVMVPLAEGGFARSTLFEARPVLSTKTGGFSRRMGWPRHRTPLPNGIEAWLAP